MTTYRYREKDYSEEFQAADDDDAKAIAADKAESGDYGDLTHTIWVRWYLDRTIVDGDGDEAWDDFESGKAQIDPDEPKCSGGEHDWQSPYAIVGGSKENPGVWGDGGGVKSLGVCMHCGCGRHSTSWGQDPEDGEQGLDAVRYEPGAYADEVAAMQEPESDAEEAA